MTNQREKQQRSGGEADRQRGAKQQPDGRRSAPAESDRSGARIERSRRREASSGGGRRPATGVTEISHYREAFSRHSCNDRRDTDHEGRRTADPGSAERGDGYGGGCRRYNIHNSNALEKSEEFSISDGVHNQQNGIHLDNQYKLGSEVSSIDTIIREADCLLQKSNLMLG
ncbi:hypothetical protein Scep_019336 [Stephania cephalantha]|uniref:Uncharacterized protein n=1 Tax=Stephania cephalantha TaxID=152367 RepID=A0AAP0NL90_9MAGN